MVEHYYLQSSNDFLPIEKFKKRPISSIRAAEIAMYNINNSLLVRRNGKLVPEISKIQTNPNDDLVTDSILTTIINGASESFMDETTFATDTSTKNINVGDPTYIDCHKNHKIFIICLISALLLLLLLCCCIACAFAKRKRKQYYSLKSDEEGCDKNCTGYSRPLLTSDSEK